MPSFMSVIVEPQILDNRACIEAYGKQFLSDRRDVLVVVSRDMSGVPNYGASQHKLHPESNGGAQPWSWLCWIFDYYGGCHIGDMLAQADTWKMGNATVQYCVSESMPERCSLQYSLHIMIAVIICNAVKSICMFLVVFKSKDDPLVTVGDAITSFLNVPDEMTTAMCTISKRDIDRGIWEFVIAVVAWKQWYPRRLFWHCAASRRRWLICNFL